LYTVTVRSVDVRLSLKKLSSP